MLTNADGLTLYGFLPDKGAARSHQCVGACAKAWPPVSASSLAGLEPKLYKLVTRPDGTLQVKVGDWLAYTYSGDGKLGEVNGLGVAGKWFPIDPTGKLIKQAGAGAAGGGAGTSPTTRGTTGY
ncbi:MAG: hypothetical protein JWN46_3832 [Acidimicrobiales bacterium]|nr:hypothetical protein [Acidimicrobiales bacterium]